MIQLAFYGKGGIGKSTTVSNLAAALSEKGLRVVQIGCDPKADSTLNLCHGKRIPTVMETCRKHNDDFKLSDVVVKSDVGVYCAETGGPIPGVGCAGRGVISALEKLKAKGLYETLSPDVVLYDVLGDVVCGGFAMPMRRQYAQSVYILTSGEAMSIYAAANIAMAVDRFKKRHYAGLGGFIVNRYHSEEDIAQVAHMAGQFHSGIVGRLPDDEIVKKADQAHDIVLRMAGDSPLAETYRKLAECIYARECGSESC
ncbi:nucleotide-binding protein [Pseudoramibacter sp.]|jgi:nitrogenase iron protein NifH|uniref:nucleotide-binding protein n=1 Tax=Pseudoramibacter sp. TaxID=2034862 RepID=UPI0025EBE22B|nr:AAA family ATPase [Pseudoramibacter sp.]MCH4072566.1 AAA family ATPase [Pseudoramibacter sp.]MCH4106337.1 AAA family ATPase [Pseudoramibacter sp.]